MEHDTSIMNCVLFVYYTWRSAMFSCRKDNFLIRWCVQRKVKLIAALLAASLLLYGFIGLAAPPGISLTEPDICNETFGSDRTKDLRKIASYSFPDVAPYIKLLFPRYQDPSDDFNLQHKIVSGSHVTVPAIVTAADYSHFKESMNLISNLNQGLRKVYAEMKLIYFDLGLSTHQKQQLLEMCRCEVRPFPFEKLPPHVKVLKGYAWKPICLQLVLNDYPFALWMDASVRIKTSDLDWLFEKIKAQGVMAGEGSMSIAARTKQSTFRFLKELPCLYRRQEFEGTFIAVYLSKFVQAYFMQPWVSCALSKGCMVLDNYPLLHLQCGTVDHFYHECHRYDQSVLSILMHRLFHSDLEDHMMKRYTFYKYCSEGEQWRILPEFINDYINRKWYTNCRYG